MKLFNALAGVDNAVSLIHFLCIMSNDADLPLNSFYLKFSNLDCDLRGFQGGFE